MVYIQWKSYQLQTFLWTNYYLMKYVFCCFATNFTEGETSETLQKVASIS